MPEVPQKYQPEPRKCDDKQWLREQYWGDEFLSAAEIAERCELSRTRVGKRLRKFGIPRRPVAYAKTNSTSPFAGFYNDNESVPDNDPQATEYDAEKAPEYKHQWVDFTPGRAGEADV